MYRRPPLAPTMCPPGFGGRYVVVPGDTLYSISLLFRVRFEGFVVVNQHIPNPNVLVPGDVLCVPPFSACSLVLKPRRDPANFLISGTVSITTGPGVERSLSVVATLPAPSAFGDFDRYVVYAIRRYNNSFHATAKPLAEVPNNPNTWAARIGDISDVLLSPDTIIVISANKGDVPPPGVLVLLEGNFYGCR
ncbi:LysM peptidoglycan-binding domain-containing protein [Effusibacillus consociatus]|uniref:LysM peptidoglycan-binding domain-containing protein n=1 Tax=Effusibacillus consociatus TaxID=1117041 RepID=A0ABV9PWV2_9BACL